MSKVKLMDTIDREETHVLEAIDNLKEYLAETFSEFRGMAKIIDSATERGGSALEERIIEILTDSVLPRLKLSGIHALLNKGMSADSSKPTAKTLADLKDRGILACHRNGLDGWSLASRADEDQPYVNEQTVETVLLNPKYHRSRSSYLKGDMKRTRLFAWLGGAPSTRDPKIYRLLDGMVKRGQIQMYKTAKETSYGIGVRLDASV